MSLLRTSLLLGLAVVSVQAASENPFISFSTPPAQPITVEEHLSLHDLPRLRAFRGAQELQCASTSANATATPPGARGNDELAPAVECRERGGLPNFFARLRAGEEVRIAYLGGSITAQDGWRPKTLKWFQEKYPAARISGINAAIGGTGSDLGVFRLAHDVLEKKPNLLFVEFAVNDGGASVRQIQRCMEGIVRQTWKQDPTTDICFVYTLAGNMLQTLQEGHFPRSATAMETVADHYRIPSIHMGVEVARLEKAGKLIFKGDKPKTEAEILEVKDKILFSPDAVHPYTDTGHQLYLEAIVRAMGPIEKAGRAGGHELGSALVADNWEKAKLLALSKATLSAGWQRLDARNDPLAKSFGQRVPELWKASQPGESISFRFRGTTLLIYDLLGPDCGQVSVVVDGGKPEVKPRFDAYCTYHRLATLPVLEGRADTEHKVTITILPEQPDKAKILSQRGEKIDDPKRFDGTAWYAGGLLLIGDL